MAVFVICKLLSFKKFISGHRRSVEKTGRCPDSRAFERPGVAPRGHSAALPASPTRPIPGIAAPRPPPADARILDYNRFRRFCNHLATRRFDFLHTGSA